MLAALPEPDLTTPVSAEVTVSADARLIACSRLGASGFTVRSRCSADWRMCGVTLRPWLSRVA